METTEWIRRTVEDYSTDPLSFVLDGVTFKGASSAYELEVEIPISVFRKKDKKIV